MEATIKFNLPQTVSYKNDVSDEEIFEWVAFNTGYSSEISTKNPLYDYEFEAIDLDVKD